MQSNISAIDGFSRTVDFCLWNNRRPRAYLKNAVDIGVWNPISLQLTQIDADRDFPLSKVVSCFCHVGHTHTRNWLSCGQSKKQHSLLLRGSQFWQLVSLGKPRHSHFHVLRKVMTMTEPVGTCSAVLLYYWTVFIWWLLTFWLGLVQRSSSDGPRENVGGPWRNLDIICNFYVCYTVSLYYFKQAATNITLIILL
jgi:hypothetical protein